jgi:L-gulonate 5-dehydrogenase
MGKQIDETMRAMVMRDFGEPDVLQPETVPTPRPGSGEVLIRVGAVEVSSSRDVAVRSGRHPYSAQLRLPHVLGGDSAGVVLAVGTGVDPALTGQRVAVMNHHTCGRCGACRTGDRDNCDRLEMVGIHRWGTYAEYAVVHADGVHLLPDDLDLAHAAALAATGPVALTQLRRTDLAEGDQLLVAGATGALASTIFALAETLGIRTVGLSRRPDQVVGATAVVDITRSDVGAAVLAATHGARPSAAIDNVCASDSFTRYFPTLGNGSRIVVSGAIGDPQPVLPVPARELYVRSITLIGVRSHTDAVTEEFWKLVRAGFRLPPGLLHEYPLDAAAQVHAAVEAGRTTGHTLLRVTSPIAPGKRTSR